MKTDWVHETFFFKEKLVVLGTEVAERSLTAADEDDASLGQARLDEATEFASHVDALAQLHLDPRKTGALRLMTSKSIAMALEFGATVVSPKKLKPLAETLEAKTRNICEKLTEGSFHDDVREKGETADEPGRDVTPSTAFAAGNLV